MERIKEIFMRVLAFFKSKNAITFLIFVALATLWWFMYSNTAQRELSVSMPISYVGLSDNVLVEEPLPKSISFSVKDEGHQLWGYRSRANDTLFVDLSSLDGQTGVLNIDFEADYQYTIASHYPSTAKILDIKPKEFRSPYKREKMKKVPLCRAGELKINPQYILLNEPSLSQDSIQIVGIKQVIDTIKRVYYIIPDQEIKQSTILECELKPIEKVQYRVNSVQLSVEVESATEKDFIVPIVPINVPEGYELRSFPTEVMIKFSVGLSNYYKAEPSLFSVVLDYKNLSKKKNEAELRVDMAPDFVNNIHLVPEEVEYILEK